MNAHSFKYSGLANNSTVDISSGLVIKTKVGHLTWTVSFGEILFFCSTVLFQLQMPQQDSKVQNKPSKAYNAPETLNYRFPSKVAARTVTIVSAVRPDLSKAAYVRAAKYAKSLRVQNSVRAKKAVKVAKVTRRSK